jgi:hypothetical protein
MGGHAYRFGLGLCINNDFAFVIHLPFEPMRTVEQMGLTGRGTGSQSGDGSMVVGTALVTTASGMAVFWIWHGLRKIDLFELFPAWIGLIRAGIGCGGCLVGQGLKTVGGFARKTGFTTNSPQRKMQVNVFVEVMRQIEAGFTERQVKNFIGGFSGALGQLNHHNRGVINRPCQRLQAAIAWQVHCPVGHDSAIDAIPLPNQGAIHFDFGIFDQRRLKKLKKIPIQVILEAMLPVGQGSQRNIKDGQGLSGFHGWAAKIRKNEGILP